MDELNTMTAAETADYDDWDDIDLTGLTDDETQPDAEPESGGGEDDGGENQPAGGEPQEPAEPEPDGAPKQEADQSFTLKYLGQERSYSRDEMTGLAQKGLDYDRVRAKYDELMAKAEENRLNASLAEFVRDAAQRSGQTPERFMLSARAANIAKEKGIPLADAMREAEFDAKEKALSAREAALREKAQAPEKAKQEPDEKSRLRTELTEFFRAHPEVRADQIDEEMRRDISGGMRVEAAWAKKELKALKAENERLKKEAENARRSVGSAQGAGKKPQRDAFDEAWYDGT